MNRFLVTPWRHDPGVQRRAVVTTIRDVARLAGVSPATVSRVLNDNPEVGPEFVTRVQAAIAQLDYRPNVVARNLRRRATTVIGVIISDVTNPFFTGMIRAVEDVAQAAGYSVVLANADEDLDKEIRYLEVAAAERMAGVVLSPASSRHTSVDVLTEAGIPVVTVDRLLQGSRADSVVVGNRTAARQATEHLIEQGCQRIAFIAGSPGTSTAADRLAGHRQALRAAGRPAEPSLIVCGGFRLEGGHAATAELLRRDPMPDGLVVANNLMTLGALQCLVENDIDIPERVAIVGFDDLPWSRALRPALTVVAQPIYEVGRRAAELLLRRINGDASPPQRVVLPATLTVRDSSRRSAAER